MSPADAAAVREALTEYTLYRDGYGFLRCSGCFEEADRMTDAAMHKDACPVAAALALLADAGTPVVESDVEQCVRVVHQGGEPVDIWPGIPPDEASAETVADRRVESAQPGNNCAPRPPTSTPSALAPQPAQGRAEAGDAWDEEVRSVSVKSCADGTMRMEPNWIEEPLEPGCTPVGVGTRLAFASFCESAINAALRAPPAAREETPEPDPYLESLVAADTALKARTGWNEVIGSAAPAAGAVQRYRLETLRHHGKPIDRDMAEHDEGEWLRYADAARYLPGEGAR